MSTEDETMKKKDIAYEMARRKLQFHKDEDWDKIRLWSLFRYEDISYALKAGWLINHLGYSPANGIYWVIPSKEFWENDIKPLTENQTLGELAITLTGGNYENKTKANN